MTLKKTGIYKITNPNGKVYIGQSIDIYNRLKSYYKVRCNGQVKIYRSLIKYGVENHTFEIIKECNRHELNDLEIKYISIFDSCNNGLNASHGGLSSSPTDETKIKMSLSHKGEKSFWYGKKHTKEMIKKYSDARIGKFKNGDHPGAKTILNTSSGIFYETIKEASFSFGIKRTTLSMKLIGKNKNNTPFVYA